MSSKKLLCLFPIDGDLAFLKRLVKTMEANLPGFTKHKLSNNLQSHISAKAKLKNCTSSDLICLFGHGRTSGLLGCSYKAMHPDGSPNRFVYSEQNGMFLGVSDSELFKNKKIFCLACDSIHWGRKIVNSGAEVFLGFNDINFDTRFYLEKNIQRLSIERLVKYELRKAVNYALSKAFEIEMNFLQLSSLIKLCIVRSSDILLLRSKVHKGKRFYIDAAQCLNEMKEGIVVYGNGETKVITLAE